MRNEPGRSVDAATVERLRYFFGDLRHGVERCPGGPFIVWDEEHDERAHEFLDSLPARIRRNMYALKVTEGRLLIVWRRWRRFCSTYSSFTRHAVASGTLIVAVNADFRTQVL